MKIGIIGLGFVGLSFASVLASKGYTVIGVDYDKIKLNKIKNGKAPFYEPKLDVVLKTALKSKLTITPKISSVVNDCELIFVTVGTPYLKDGSIDLSKIKNVAKEIGYNLRKSKNHPVIIIKSTVVPGTTKNVIIPLIEKNSQKKIGKDFGVITNPEFLRESKAIDDTINPHVVVLGNNNDKFLNSLKKFYEKFYKKVPIVITNYQTAELIKYANNTFLATKISFINQIANICENIPGVNIEDVAKTIGLDPRIGKLFLNAGPGYGGSCLPKDVKAIIDFSKKNGVKPTLLNAVEEINQNQVKKIVDTVENILGKIKGKKITVFGLSFKPETDDIRDSISINLIKILYKKGAILKVHDPKALENTKMVFGKKIIYCNSRKNALNESHCLVIMTPWNQYTQLKNSELNVMKNRVIVDSRRLLVNKKINAKYYAVGLGT